jgi:hypothetical protein
MSSDQNQVVDHREDDLWYRNMPPCNLGDDFYAFIINKESYQNSNNNR